MSKFLLVCLLLFGTVATAQTAPSATQQQKGKRDEIKTLDQLQKALDEIQAISIIGPEQKSFYANQARSEYEINRRKSEDAYADDLHKALDAWYANSKNWRKVPDDIWSKLTERDKGRIKDGLDPETLARPCQVTAHR